MEPLICLFTLAYPYGDGEEFIAAEVEVLCKIFDRVLIFPRSFEGRPRKIPANAEVVQLKRPVYSLRKRLLRKNAVLIFRVLLTEFATSRQRLEYLKNFSSAFATLINQFAYGELIYDYIRALNRPPLLYSYWLVGWNLALSLLSFRYPGRYLHVARAHRFDLFEEKSAGPYIPFRSFCVRNTDWIFPDSKQGEEVLKRYYPRYASRIAYHHLGTHYAGTNPAPKNEDAPHIVSCSYLKEVKRIDLIIDALSLSKCVLRWTHIGDGPMRALIEKKLSSLPPSIHVHLTGQLSYPELMAFYRREPIDLFINVSSSEGIPVSIMEALSFGIPVLATNVGGISEIVNSENGRLAPVDIQGEELVSLIESARTLCPSTRGEIQDSWRKFFEAEHNFTIFARKLVQLSNLREVKFPR